MHRHVGRSTRVENAHSGVQGLLEQVEEAVGAISQLETTRKGLKEAGRELENAATEAKEVDRAVLPFENSLGGSIHRKYDFWVFYLFAVYRSNS